MNFDRFDEKYYEWRISCLRRDNFTCQVCHKKTHNLEVHHIINFNLNDDLKYDINNGITMCHKCHLRFHKRYGFTNNTKEQLDDFLKNRKRSVVISTQGIKIKKLRNVFK